MPRRASVDQCQRSAFHSANPTGGHSPNLVAEPAVLRRPRDEPDTPFDVPPRTFVLTLRLHISLCRRTRSQSFGIERSKLSKCLAHPRLWNIGSRRGAELGLSEVGRGNRGQASVENDP